VSGHFVPGDRFEDRGLSAHLELAIGAPSEEQEKLHYLESMYFDSRTTQVECGRMVAQERSIVGSRDLVNYQRLAAKSLLEPATNQLLTVLSKNWLN
jgi:hypothetical protein